ncbi:pyrroline-5-carboxylate reductase ProI [Lentibacillus halophilus]|uniref:Pyrroline-5-carboxylate reductase n=1 Tax=Lentibacillus halophilus TaxID=295065 RepID=A0ABN0Z5X4_9BACI
MAEKMAFIGAGSMAESILSGILNSGFLPKENIMVTNKSDQKRLEHLGKQYNISYVEDKQQTVADAHIVLLAVKPYDMEAAIDSIRDHLDTGQLLISIAAGVSTETISQMLGRDIPVIRAMPNTSAAAGASATAITRGKFATEDHLATALELFSTLGTATEVAEEDMHTVTAIAGSGPAYVYYLVESMEAAAIEAGLNKQTAQELLIQTIAGAAEMLRSSGEDPSKLRENVTSPGGTTQAGLEALDQGHFREAVMNCVTSARERSIELGKTF